MLHPLSLPPLVMAGVTFYAGFYHLLIFVRRRHHREDLTFALTCVAMGLYDLFSACLYSASSVDQGMRWQRAQVATLGLISTAFLWFISDYTSRVPKRVLWLSSAYFLLAALVGVFDDTGLVWVTEQPSIKSVQLPLNLSITYYEATPGPLTHIQSVAGVGLFLYALWIGVILFRSGDRQKAGPLLLAVGLAFLGVLNDSAVSSGFYEFFYVMEYAYLSLVLLMAYSLSGAVVEATEIKHALQESEARYRSLFEDSPISLWEEDFSAIKAYIDDLSRSGVTDWVEYFATRPEEVVRCAQMVRVVDVNQATLELYGAEASMQLQQGLDILFRKESIDTFSRELVALASGEQRFDSEAIQQTLDGRKKHVALSVAIAPGYEETWGKVFVSVLDITQRKLVEEERLRLVRIIGATSDLISTALPDGHILSMNRGGRILLGWGEGEETSRKIADAHPQWALDVIEREGIPTALREGIWTGETAVLGGDGTEIPVSQVIMAHRSAEDELTYLSTIVRDISELREAERAVRRSERLLSSAFAALDGLLVVIDRDHRIVVCNWKEHEFVPPEDRQGHPLCYQVFKHLDRPCDYCPPVDTFADGQFRIYEDVNPIDGTYKEISVSPVFDEDGDVIMVVEHVRDITARKQDEEALRERADRLEVLGRIGRQATAILSLDELLDHAVQLIGDTFGYYSVNVLLLEGDYLVPMASTRMHMEAVEDLPRLRVGIDGITGWVAKTREPLLVADVSQDERYWRGPEEPDTRSELAVPLTAKGELIGVLDAQSTELSAFSEADLFTLQTAADQLAIAIENARLYEKVRASVVELEQRVRERTAELAAVNKELEAFAYSVSHDLRAPLRSVDGFSKVLLERYGDGLDATGQDYLRRVRRAAQRMGQLIDDLLDLSRVSQREVHRQEVDLSRLVEEITTRLRAAQPQREVEFVIASNVLARGDRRLLQVAVENLLSNAWKFTAKRAQAVIEFGVLEEEDERVYFVRDDGAGFDPAQSDRLFRVFQRLHRAEEFEGTGIGLATVQRVIHRHGGRIWAEGAIDEGAVFYFTL